MSALWALAGGLVGIGLAMAGIVAVQARQMQRMLRGYGEQISFPASVRKLLSSGNER